jgi:hypothetical protein
MILTRGLGSKQTLLTRGFTQLYILVDDDTPSVRRLAGGGSLRQAIDEDLIKTKKIIVKQNNKNVEVTAILINRSDMMLIEAELIKLKQDGIIVSVIDRGVLHD